MSQGPVPSSSSTTGVRPAAAVGVSVGDDDGGDNPFLQPGDDEQEAPVDDMALDVVAFNDWIDLTGEDICRVFFSQKQTDGSKALLVCGYPSAACRRHHAVKRSDLNWRGLARWYVRVNVRDGVTDGRATPEDVQRLRQANSAADRVRNEDEDASGVPSTALSIVHGNQGNGQPDVEVPSPTSPPNRVQFAFNRTPVRQHTNKTRRFDANGEFNPIISRQSFPFPSDGNSKRKECMDKEDDDDDKNQGEEKATMEGSNVAVRPDDEDEYKDYLSKEEEQEANEQQQKLEEDVAIIGGNPTESQPRFTHTRFEQFKSEVLAFNIAKDWPRMLKIVEQLPLASQKEEYCKNSYEALQGITRENIRGEGEFEALSNASDAANKIAQFVVETSDKVIKVNDKLAFLSGRSQGDSTSTSTAKSSIALGSRSASNPKSNDSLWSRDCKKIRLQVEPEQLWNEPSKKLETFGDKRIGDFSDLENSHKQPLLDFNASLQSQMKRATVFNGKPKKFVRTGFKCGLVQFEKALYECSEKKKSKKKKSLSVPGPMAAEVDYVQSFLLVVLQALGSVVDKTFTSDALAKPTAQPDSGSPAKTSVQTNRICPKTQFRPKRIADKSISANGQFIFILRDDSVEIPVEVKRGQRSNCKPSSLLVQGSNQILSHLAKHVGIGFNFASVGVDTKATGVVLTPAYVNIIQLQLKNAGTRDIELITLETGCLPLLLEENLIKWTGSYAEDWSDLKTSLYPPGNTEPEVPTGLVALWNLMTSSRKDLFGPPPCTSSCLQDLIGFGEYASVYSGKDEYKGCVIKLSRYGATAALEKEAKALQTLQHLSSDYIPRLIKFKSELPPKSELPLLKVEIGGVLKELPALILQPCGISVQHYIASLELNDKKDALRAIGTDAANGVFFIHKNGMFHNDVSPKNIIVDITGTKQKNARGMLIDFGLASLKLEKITGFQGNFLFAHRSVFLKYPNTKWEPMRDYDQSSLAFSMAALARWTIPSNEKNALWKSFQPRSNSVDTRNALNKWATNRSNIAWKYLEEAGFPKVDKKNPKIQWKKWCFDI